MTTVKTTVAAIDDQSFTHGVEITGAMKNGKPYPKGIYVSHKTLGGLSVEVGDEVELTFDKVKNGSGEYFCASAIKLVAKQATEETPESKPADKTRKLKTVIAALDDQSFTHGVEITGTMANGNLYPKGVYVSYKTLGDLKLKVGSAVELAIVKTSNNKGEYYRASAIELVAKQATEETPEPKPYTVQELRNGVWTEKERYKYQRMAQMRVVGLTQVGRTVRMARG